MESSEQQRRQQYDSSTYARGQAPHPQARGANMSNVSNVRGPVGGMATDAMRQPPLLTSRGSTSATLPTGAAGGPHDLTNFGYAQAQQYAHPQFQGGSLQYQSDYSQDAPRQQQHFSQYAPQVLYGVSQQVSPAHASYDAAATGQFQNRQSANADTLPGQYGNPQFYPSGTPSSATPQVNNPQYSNAQFQPAMAFNTTTTADLARSTLASGFPNTETDFTPTANDEPAESEQRQPDRFDVFYSQYRRVLKETNDNASRGRLIEASESLLELSSWLLGNVENLGKRATYTAGFTL